MDIKKLTVLPLGVGLLGVWVLVDPTPTLHQFILMFEGDNS
jgi:hypothetical protein